MGTVFSKKLTIKDKLLKLENEALKTEYELNRLINSTSYAPLVLGCILVPLVAYLPYALGLSGLLALVPLGAVLASLYYALELLKKRRIAGKDRRLKALQSQRRALVEQCRTDESFATTRSIIEKYDTEQSRSTFFSQLKRKKKSAMDTVTDFVLGSDPSQLTALICKDCGMHNGLVDPRNDDFTYFQCYHCDFRNERKSKVGK